MGQPYLVNAAAYIERSQEDAQFDVPNLDDSVVGPCGLKISVVIES